MANVVALIVEGLRRCVPDAVPQGTSVQSLGGDETGVPLEPYRAFLHELVEKKGAACILQAGRALEGLTDPILFVLLNSDQIDVLIEKEARLSRTIHSRHIVRILEHTENSIRLEHVSTVEDPPRFTENLASAGQHIVLLELLGCRGLTLRLPKGRDPSAYVYDRGTYADPGHTGCGEWLFSWDTFEPTRQPMPGLDEVLLAGETRSELAEVSETVAGIERIVRSDMARTWTVREVANRLDTSTRSLQRALASESARFSDVVDQLRVTEAKRLLESTELTVTEIGYVCGFADTSHFSRRFKTRIGTSPSAHRAGKQAPD